MENTNSEIQAKISQIAQAARKVSAAAPQTIQAEPDLAFKVVQKYSTMWMTKEGTQWFVNHCDQTQNFSININNVVLNKYFLEGCKPGGKTLDIGCGHGVVATYLAQHGQSVVACDISPHMVEALNQRKGNLPIETRVGSGYQIPAADEEFDTVLSRHFLPMFPDWPKIVKEMARVCKPGGKVLLNFSCSENRRYGEQAGGKPCNWHTTVELNHPDKHYHTDTTPAELQSLAPSWGLKYLKAMPLQFFHENRIIGHSLGTEEYEKYYQELQEWGKDPKVLEFMIWFEQRVVQKLPPMMTYCGLFVMEKEGRSYTNR